jgi:hypothetical protein
MALLLPIGYVLLDVYRVHGQAPIERFPLRIKATCLLFALLVGWHYAAPRMLWPVGAAALTFVLAVVLPLIGEGIIRTILIRHPPGTVGRPRRDDRRRAYGAAGRPHLAADARVGAATRRLF